jgi:hypothetical protein
MSITNHCAIYETEYPSQNPNDPEAAEKFQEMAAAFVLSHTVVNTVDILHQLG